MNTNIVELLNFANDHKEIIGAILGLGYLKLEYILPPHLRIALKVLSWMLEILANGSKKISSSPKGLKLNKSKKELEDELVDNAISELAKVADKKMTGVSVKPKHIKKIIEIVEDSKGLDSLKNQIKDFKKWF